MSKKSIEIYSSFLSKPMLFWAYFSFSLAGAFHPLQAQTNQNPNKQNQPSSGASVEAKPATNVQNTSPESFPAVAPEDPLEFIKSTPRVDDGNVGVIAPGQDQGRILIRNSHVPKRGIRVNPEVPSVRHVTMAPASKKFGGDDVEIVISPIYDVLIQMPDAIEYFKSSSSSLIVSPVATNPQMIALKLVVVQQTVPVSLHLVDVNQQIYTFTVIGAPADLAWEYPKTVIVNKKSIEKVQLGSKNPGSILNGMDLDDAVQMVVGDVPNTDEYLVEMVSGKFMHHEGYAQYGFKISRKDKKEISKADDGSPQVKFTIWANNKRLDSGSKYSLSRDVEWTLEPLLSGKDTRRSGIDTLRVFVQIRASILDLEEWPNAFITVSDGFGYTRFDFEPIRRSFRPVPKKAEGGN